MTNIIILFVLLGGGLAIFNAIKASKEESVEDKTMGSLPPTIAAGAAALDPASLSAFIAEYHSRKKKVSIAYLLWFAFGWHYIYLRKIGLQFAFWFTFGGLGIWAFADLFMMRSHVRSANEAMARDLLQTATIGSSMRNQTMVMAAALNQNPPPPAPIAGA